MLPVLGVLGWMLSAPQAGFAADTSSGRHLYVAKCQACHGVTGRGDGPAAAALPRAPRSFASKEFWENLTNEKLAAVIIAGKPGTAMRGFPMEPAQMSDLIAYLRDFQPSTP